MSDAWLQVESYVCVSPLSPASAELQDGHNPVDRRLVLRRLLHSR